MLKKNLTLDDFHITSYISWDELETVLGKRRFKKFGDWMFGQTSYKEGAYVHDVERFLGTLKGIPTYFD